MMANMHSQKSIDTTRRLFYRAEYGELGSNVRSLLPFFNPSPTVTGSSE